MSEKRIKELEAELAEQKKKNDEWWKHVLDTYQKLTDEAGLDIVQSECAWEDYVSCPLELLDEEQDRTKELEAELALVKSALDSAGEMDCEDTCAAKIHNLISDRNDYHDWHKKQQTKLARKNNKRILELEDDVRMNSHMVAKLNDETVPEKDHENLRAELQQARDAYATLSVAVRNFLPPIDRTICNRECKGCSAEGKCEDQVLRLCEENPGGE